MRRIALVTNIPSPYRVDLFHYMQTALKEYEIHVVYTNKAEANREWTIEEDKLINSVVLKSKVIRVKGKIDDRFIHIPPNIGKVLSSINPDVVIAFEYNPAALKSLLWCKTHRVPFIHLTDGTLNSEKAIGTVQKLSRKIITRGAATCIASSTKAKEKLLSYGIQDESIFISLLTVNRKQYAAVNAERIPGRLLYVGSMVKRKGLDLLIASLPHLKAEWQLHIVGNGSQQEKVILQKAAETANVADRITWCGYKEGTDLVHEYKEASVFVLPTREDCFGLVLLEALYAGTPIVASSYADGAYDIVENGVNGLIADPYQAKEFAVAIDRVLESEVYSAEAGKTDTSKFLFCNVAKGYCDAIEHATAHR